MADNVNPRRLGLALGVFAAVLHTIWVIIVAAGVGPWLANLKMALHFVVVPYAITGFDGVTALIGIALAFVVAYAVGWLFGWFWNWSGKHKRYH